MCGIALTAFVIGAVIAGILIFALGYGAGWFSREPRYCCKCSEFVTVYRGEV